ncbi:MAG: hypothetical protein MRY83_21595, partial [Flavobacteriales bacterium]|nr:hypothetical protein [Flavobacteriales bacterium]
MTKLNIHIVSGRTSYLLVLLITLVFSTNSIAQTGIYGGNGSLGAGTTVTQGNNDLTFDLNGTGTFNIQDNNGNLLRVQPTGSLGIGTNSPFGRLHLYQPVAGNSWLQIETSDATHGNFMRIGSVVGNARKESQIQFEERFGLWEVSTGSTLPRLYINENGNIGIGTGNPVQKFNIHNDVFGNDSALVITNAGNLGIGTTTASKKLSVEGESYFQGNMAIGHKTPGASALHIKDGAAELRVETTSAIGARLRFYDSGAANNASIQHFGSPNRMELAVQGGQVITLLETGNVGIGTTGPVAKLHIDNDATGADSSYYFHESGNFSIGTASDLVKLEIQDGSSNLRFQESTAISGFVMGDGEENLAIATQVTSGASNVPNGAYIYLEHGSEEVGIGTTSTDIKLDVYNDKGAGDIAHFENTVGKLRVYQDVSGGGIFSEELSGLYITPDDNNIFLVDGNSIGSIDSSGSFNLRNGPSGSFYTYLDPTSNSYFNGTGNFGIGTTSPNATLHLKSVDSDPSSFNEGLKVEGGSNKSVVLGADATYSWVQSHGSVPLHINKIGNNTILNADAGAIGIGEDAPTNKLHVTSASDPVKLEGLVNDPSLDTVITVDANGVLHKAAFSALSSNDGDWTLDGDTMYSAFDSTITVKDQKVGIGTTGPTAELDVLTENLIPGYTMSKFTSGGGRSLLLMQPDPSNGGDPWTWRTSNAFNWRVDATDALTIASNSFVGIGTTAPDVELVIDGGTRTEFRMKSSDTQSIFMDNYNSDPHNSIKFRTADGTPSAPLVLQDNDRIGFINFEGYDGTGYIDAAVIEAHSDGQIGTNDMPGRLSFKTTADGDNSATERMRIQSDGYVGIGTTQANAKLHIREEISSEPGIYVHKVTSGTGAGIEVKRNTLSGSTIADLQVLTVNDNPATSDRISGVGFATYDNSAADLQYHGVYARKVNADSADLRFAVNSQEDMTITSRHNVGIGVSAPDEKLQIDGNIYINKETAGVIVDASNNKRTGFMKYFSKETGIWRDNVDFEIGRVTGGGLLAPTGYETDLYVGTTGWVGINTDAPTNRLHIVNNVDPIRAEGLVHDATLDTLITVAPNGVFHKTAFSALTSNDNDWTLDGNVLYSAPDSAVIIKNGNVGIGTTSSQAKLNIQHDSVQQSSMLVKNANGTIIHNMYSGFGTGWGGYTISMSNGNGFFTADGNVGQVYIGQGATFKNGFSLNTEGNAYISE